MKSWKMKACKRLAFHIHGNASCSFHLQWQSQIRHDFEKTVMFNFFFRVSNKDENKMIAELD